MACRVHRATCCSTVTPASGGATGRPGASPELGSTLCARGCGSRIGASSRRAAAKGDRLRVSSGATAAGLGARVLEGAACFVEGGAGLGDSSGTGEGACAACGTVCTSSQVRVGRTTGGASSLARPHHRSNAACKPRLHDTAHRPGLFRRVLRGDCVLNTGCAFRRGHGARRRR